MKYFWKHHTSPFWREIDATGYLGLRLLAKNSTKINVDLLVIEFK